jgi:dipeptidase E
MKKLFLASSFKNVANLLKNFAKESLKGKTVTFIPATSIPETVKFYVSSGKDETAKDIKRK